VVVSTSWEMPSGRRRRPPAHTAVSNGVRHSGERASLEQGSMHLVRYSLVERWVELGWVEVL
jgi:hypothetical protein